MNHRAVAAPANRLRTVLLLAQIDAVSLLAIAGPAAVASLVAREWFAAAVGGGIVLCAGLEWSGRSRLLRTGHAGIGRMATAQLGCLALILAYAGHLARQPAAEHLLQLLPAFTRAQLEELFPDPAEVHQLLLALQHVLAALVAVAALLCQGGLALFYLRSRARLRASAVPPLLDPPVSQA